MERYQKVVSLTVVNRDVAGYHCAECCERLHDVRIGVTDTAPSSVGEGYNSTIPLSLCAVVASFDCGEHKTIQCVDGGVVGKYLVIQIDSSTGTYHDNGDVLTLCEVYNIQRGKYFQRKNNFNP